LSDLAEYYSIQQDFPLSYGIGAAGPLQPTNPEAVGKARQLKAMLLNKLNR
jgi:hypothetical protein